jgi:chromatin segregation and condensation protein Rec8/ScpA/Scc1 (kleisin family)
LHDENYEIKEKVYDILHDIYFSTDKEKEFNPKKIEEAVGYFMYLLRAFHSDFRCQVV